MSGTPEEKQRAVEELARANHAHYSQEENKKLFELLQLGFEERWIYLFELIQNAIDVEARRIRIDREAGQVVFQHDGRKKLRAKDVAGLSKVLGSTKGATTVGFMGVGFKSVFLRYRRAEVSGDGWSLRYRMRVAPNPYTGVLEEDWLGTVTPEWAPELPPPDEGFTTRFVLADPHEGMEEDFERDLGRILGEDPTVLVFLANRGLRRLEVPGEAWSMQVEQDQFTLRRDGEEAAKRWRRFAVGYAPTEAAVSTFLKHRRLKARSEEEGARLRIRGAGGAAGAGADAAGRAGGARAASAGARVRVAADAGGAAVRAARAGGLAAEPGADGAARAGRQRVAARHHPADRRRAGELPGVGVGGADRSGAGGAGLPGAAPA